MKLRLNLMRPTLVRRVMLTLLAAAALVWLALIAFYYWQESAPTAAAARQQQRGEAILAVLSQIDDAAAARQAAALYAALFNSVYLRAGVPEQFVLQLSDRQGQSLYRSPGADSDKLSTATATTGRVQFNDTTYQLFRGHTTQWTLLLAEPAPAAALLLAKLSSNLSISMLIALPLLLLPVWLAVARGLRPLQRLSDSIAARGPDDLQPLALDVTYAELTPLRTALNRLFSQLRTRIAREHSFVQDAAHELKTPLAVIAAQTHVLIRASDASAQQLAGQQLEHAVARASHLIEQLLDLARIDTAAAAPAVRLDLAQSLRQAIANLVPAALTRNIELALDAPDQLLHPVDPLAWQSVVHNLLSNAIRYGREQGLVEVGLSLQPAAAPNMLRLTVADDGPGIAAAEQALVFERFYRVAGTDIPGSGLGLAIVTQAVARMRGQVRLEPGLRGRGCCFVIELPLGTDHHRSPVVHPQET